MDKLTIDEACAKYGFQSKQLIGLCARIAFHDPIVIDRIGDEYVMLDDWRLLLAAKRAASKASGSQL